ncbi:MAG: hypothetical protein MUC80_06650 [Candidatus Thermoplasmatota archaeon]|nr:hypothetical protein [Candidatus Thermoplasmatota archaeon]
MINIGTFIKGLITAANAFKEPILYTNDTYRYRQFKSISRSNKGLRRCQRIP